jgi:glucose-6-phosphate isomerase
VGHYWLRAPELAPTPEIRTGIEEALTSVQTFAARVARGELRGSGGAFEHLVHIGIGGSTTGPQLICQALGKKGGGLVVHFLDNADPDGIDRLLHQLDGSLDRTLVSYVSKCGWTPTPRHVMLEVEAAYVRAGLDFARHAAATTTPGSELDRRALEGGWLARFPMWDWVGGRTSVTSAVGLLPAALHGIDVSALLEGAAAMDRATRTRKLKENPAALLALMWNWLGDGHGKRNMVVLPYKDQLALFGRYAQQLVMESVGKKLDRAGRVVHQGLTVYGNKGSSDQHAYFQQLRDGAVDFFATLIYCLDARKGAAVQVTPDLTLGDYLFGYLEGSRNALYERGRESITIALPEVSPRTVGALVALYERAVGIYAELINVNAYHQPGIDKSAAAEVVEIQRAAAAFLKERP